MIEEAHVADRDVSLSNLSHEELVHMLTGLQADVEARDIVIATLQCEQNFLLVDDAKRYRYFIDSSFNIDLDDPILALQRDSHLLCTSEGSSVYRNAEHCRDGKGIYLEELLDNHRRTHAFYCEQLQAAEQRYAALCASFEDEHKRLERDAAQGDDVVAMLEKEREKLQSELENERNQNKCLQKELKKALDSYAHQKALSQRQRIVAAQLIKEKHRLQKELSAKCAQIDHLECKLGLKSPLSSSRPISVNVLQNNSTAVKTPVGSSAPRSPAGGVAHGGSESENLSRKKSTSPPSACRESANAPPLPPSPLLSTTTSTVKVDSAGSPGLSMSIRVNGCSPPPPTVSFPETSSSCDLPKAKSPPPVKTRPEPPVRRTPEFSNPPPPAFTTSHKLNPLEVEISRTSEVEKVPSIGVAEDEKHAGTPSPPPPPPQMQLHYPYPGMQGNTHHPPIRGSARSTAFSGGGSHFVNSANPAISSTTHFSSNTRPALRSPTTNPGASHQFPYAQPQRVIASSTGFRLTSGGKKSTPMLLSQQNERQIPIASNTTAPHGGTSRSGGAAGSGNLYINGK